MNKVFKIKRKACPFCGEDSKLSNRYDTIIHFSDRIEVIKCHRCRGIYKYEIPDEKGFGEIYDTNYIHHTPININDEIKSQFSRVRRLGKASGLRLLDYGCGSGAFVHAACESGIDSYGLDPFLVSAEKLSSELIKERCFKGSLETVLGNKNMPQSYHIITMWAVMEHLIDVDRDISNGLKLLEPGGRLVLNCPCADSLAARFMFLDWKMATIPEHLQFVSASWMGYVSDKYGVKVEKFRFCGSPLFMAIDKASEKKALHSLSNSQKPAVTKMVGLKNLFKIKSKIQKMILKDNFGMLRMISSFIINKLRIGDHIEIFIVKKND